MVGMGDRSQIAAAIVSLAATITLIIVLKTSDDQQQRPWQIGNTQLTLNTVVAIISIVLRASLLLMISGALSQNAWNWFARKRSDHKPPLSGQPLKDLDIFGEAANNSWASLKLLYRTEFRYLVSLGGVLTILSLAFDAFTQQVLTVDTRIVQTPGSAVDVESLIPRAMSYLKAVELAFPGEDTKPIGISPPPIEAQGAIINGVLGTKRANITAVCSTGNCTWPTTPTLGLCSSCEDVKDKLSITNTSIHDGTYWPTYTLPLGDNYTNGLNNITVNTGDAVGIFSIASGIEGNGIDGNFPPGRQTIANIWALGVPPSSFSTFMSHYPTVNRSFLDSLIVAHNCSIFFCLQAFNATTKNGVFSTQRIGEWDQMIGNSSNVVDFLATNLSETWPSWSFPNAPLLMNVQNGSGYRVDW